MTESPRPDDAGNDRRIADRQYSPPLRPGIAPLKNFLLAAFSSTELRHFLREHYPYVEHALPGPEATGEAVASEAAAALERRALIDIALFRRLQAVRPQRRPELLKCAAAWQIAPEAVPPVPLDPPPAPAPGDKPRWFTFDLRVRSFRLLIVLLIPLVSLPVILRLREVPPEPRELPSNVEPPVQPLQDWPVIPVIQYHVPQMTPHPQQAAPVLEGSFRVRLDDHVFWLKRRESSAEPQRKEKFISSILRGSWARCTREVPYRFGAGELIISSRIVTHVSILGPRIPRAIAESYSNCMRDSLVAFDFEKEVAGPYYTKWRITKDGLAPAP